MLLKALGMAGGAVPAVPAFQVVASSCPSCSVSDSAPCWWELEKVEEDGPPATHMRESGKAPT